MWTRIDKSFSVPSEVRSVLSALYSAGFEAYLVGGCVRDFLLGRPIKDFDVATNATPDQVEKIFPQVIATGRAFGVLRVKNENDREVEVATFRRESGYQDHRRPTHVEFCTVEEDSARRDFTINALYYDFKTSQILDFHGGLNDIKAKTLRAIGDAEKRFEEDALRLLRAVRFACGLDFKMSAETEAAMVRYAADIRKVSIERVRDELEKILLQPHSRRAIIELDRLGFLEYVMPEISVGKLDQKKVWDQTLRVLTVMEDASGSEPVSFYWALFLLPTLRLQSVEKREDEVRVIAKRLKMSHEATDQMAYLVRETPKFKDAFSMREATLIRWMREKDFELLMRFHELDAISYDGNLAGLEFVQSIFSDAKRRFEMKPLVTGDDLVKLGLSPGRQFTEILRTIEDLTLEGAFSNQEQALSYVLKHFVK